MKQWDIWTCDFAEAGPHPAVIVSHPDRVARAPLVNVLIGSSQKASRPARENEVLLNGADGLDWETLVKCDLIYLVEKDRLYRRRGAVTTVRQTTVSIVGDAFHLNGPPMVIMLGIFYFGQDQRLEDDEAVKRAVVNTVDWIADRGYRNVLIEIANECDNNGYVRDIIKAPRMHELIELAQHHAAQRQHPLPVSVSYNGGSKRYPDPIVEP